MVKSIEMKLSTVVPDGRDLGIFTHIGGMLDNKEFVTPTRIVGASKQL